MSLSSPFALQELQTLSPPRFPPRPVSMLGVPRHPRPNHLQSLSFSIPAFSPSGAEGLSWGTRAQSPKTPSWELGEHPVCHGALLPPTGSDQVYTHTSWVLCLHPATAHPGRAPGPSTHSPLLRGPARRSPHAMFPGWPGPAGTQRRRLFSLGLQHSVSFSGEGQGPLAPHAGHILGNTLSSSLCLGWHGKI